jgi:GTP-binding protein Era
MTENDLTDLLMPEDLPPDHRSGFVSVVGKPNVGKSTLMNAYLGRKLAIVSEKPQTTRDRLLGILTLDQDRGDRADAQIIFVDTPGIHRPLHKLGEYMVETAVRTIPDADLVLFLVDVSRPPGDEDRQIATLLREQRHVPVLLVLNKADLLSAEEMAPHVEAYQQLGSFEEVQPISALRSDGLEELLDEVLERLPFGPRYYPEEQVIPYSVAVVVQDFKERSEDMTYISANIFVERDTQKAIILGQRGSMIKRIGQDARREIEELLGTRVYLELWVKVRKRWRKDDRELQRLGYALPR